MAGLDNDVIYGEGIDLSGNATVSNQLNVDGLLYIGNSGGNPQANQITFDETLKSVPGNGTLQLALSDNAHDVAIHTMNGSIIEDPSISVTSDGATITLSLEKQGGGNLTLIFESGFSTFVAAPATVTLTAGTDSVFTKNFVYILESTGALTANTSSFPATEHVAIGTMLCQTAATMATKEAMNNHQWSDHTKSTDNMGHISHLNSWIRNQPARWMDGVVQTYSIVANGGSPDNVTIATSSGSVLQLHNHTYPAFAAADDYYVANDFTTPFTIINDLNAALTDSTGASMSGKYFTLVLWCVVSQETNECKRFINVPKGSYNNATSAIADSQKFTDFSIPAEFTGTAFLESQWTVRHLAAASGTWTSIAEVDLRGTISGVSAGSGAAASSEFIDTAFRILDEGDNTKEIAFQASGITTATTRTLTVQDLDGTIALTSNFSTALALGGTVANTVKSTAITSDPGAATDSFIQFDEATVAKWRMGNDATDDSFRISRGSALGTNDVFVMTVGGERTLPTQPAFLAYLASSDTNATGTGTIYKIGTQALTEVFDQNGDMNTNGTFTAPITGRYQLCGHVYLQAIGANASIARIQIDASNRDTLSDIELDDAQATTYGCQSNILMDMDAGDTAFVEVFVTGMAGDTVTVAGSGTALTFFSGFLAV